MVKKTLKETIDSISGVSIDMMIVMPNHIHCILQLQSSALHLGEIIRRFKAKVSHECGQSVWQANYYEHIIRDENALDRIRKYITNNPEVGIMKFNQFYQERR